MNNLNIHEVLKQMPNRPIGAASTSYPKPHRRIAQINNSVKHGLRRTRIEWAECSWNPMIGCSAASTGCMKCYAREIALDLQAQGNKKYAGGFTPTFLPSMLNQPRLLEKPTVIFINSMSDLFHEAYSDEQILSVIGVIADLPQHVGIALTKRHERLLELDQKIAWPDNLIVGVSIENNEWVVRADYLRKTNAKNKAISAEPLLGPLTNLDTAGIGWLISGGESGPGARPFDPQWAEDLRQMCLKTGTAFFHKQNGGEQKHRTGRKLFGKIYDAYPQVIIDMKR